MLTKVGVGNYGALARSALVQPDGSIVVVGAYAIDAPQQNWRVALARYTAAGKLDATFGSGGIVLTSLVTGSSQADAVWDQGKILVKGSGNLYRFNTNGTLDTTFDQDGIVQTTLSGPLAVDPAGNIFVGGTSHDPPACRDRLGRTSQSPSTFPTARLIRRSGPTGSPRGTTVLSWTERRPSVSSLRQAEALASSLAGVRRPQTKFSEWLEPIPVRRRSVHGGRRP